VRAVRERLDVQERPACRWLDVKRKLFHRPSRARVDEPLRLRLIELAQGHRRYGFPRCVVLYDVNYRSRELFRLRASRTELGAVFIVLNCDLEYGLSSLTCGRL